MAAIDWKNIKFTGKEFIGAVVFVFTISGMWYNVQFRIKENQDQITNHVTEAKGKWDAIGSKIDKLETKVAELENDKRIRDALQEYNRGYYPMKKVSR